MASAILTLISIILVLTGQYLVYNRQAPAQPGLWLFLAASVLFITASLVSKAKEDAFNPAPPDDRSRVNRAGRTELVFFLAVMAVAAYFRFHEIGTMPPGAHRDEAKVAIDALDISQGKAPIGAESSLPVYIRAITDNPAMYNYIIAAFFNFAGSGITEAREASALVGTLGVAAFYFLLRYLFGPVTAVAGGFLFAAMRWDVHYSRILYHAGFSIPILIFFIYFLVRSYRERKWQDFAMLGATLALTQYTYHASRAIPFAFLLAGALFLLNDRRFYFTQWKKILLAAAVFAVVYMPMGNYVARNWDTFMSRPGGLYILSQDNIERWKGTYTPLQIYFNNAAAVLSMYNKGGDPNITYNVDAMPMAEFVTGGLAVLGFAYVVFSAFRLSGTALLIFGLFAVFIHGGILFMDAPHASRTILTMPFITLFASVAIYRIWLSFGTGGSRASRYFALLLLSALVLLPAKESHDIYFNRHAKSKWLFGGFDTAQNKAANHLLSLGSGWRGIFPPEYVLGTQKTSEMGIVLSKNPDIETEQLLLWKNIPAVGTDGKNTAYILLPKYKTFFNLLKDLYPDGKFVVVNRTFEPSIPELYIVEITAENASVVSEAGFPNGLRARYFRNGENEPFIDRKDPVVEFDWYQGARPDENGFEAEWTGSFDVYTPGIHTFYVRTWDDTYLEIDGKRVCENISPDKQWQSTGAVELSKGRHSIKLKYRSVNSYRISLLWKKPGDDYEELVPYRQLHFK